MESEPTSVLPPKLQPPFGTGKGKLDDKGRCKLPADIQKFVESWDETLIVLSLDRHKAIIYARSAWFEAAKKIADSDVDPKVKEDVLFNANDLGSEAEIDGSGRITFSAELRRELGIENSNVRLLCFEGRVEVLSDATYQVRKSRAAAGAEDKVALLQAVKAL